MKFKREFERGALKRGELKVLITNYNIPSSGNCTKTSLPVVYKHHYRFYEAVGKYYRRKKSTELFSVTAEVLTYNKT